MKSLILAMLFVTSSVGMMQMASACLVAPCPWWGNPQIEPAPVPQEPIVFTPQKVTCKMVRLENVVGEQKSATVTVKAEDGAFKPSSGLNLGEYNISYNVEYFEDSAREHSVSIIVEENMRVQDEVGSLYCEFTLEEKHKGKICKEKISFKGKDEFDFSCQLKY